VSEAGGYDAQVRAWAAALRAGDGRTWAEFRAAPAVSPASVDVSGPLPGGAQLELVRRLAHRGIIRFAPLADLVLATTSPGRGLVDPPLPWPGREHFGTPAVEPDDQPAQELVRAACAVLVRLLADQPVRAPIRRRRRGPWRRGFVVAGSPVTARAVRETLRAAGLREGGRRATYLVLGGPLGVMMAEHWSARIEDGAGMRWRRLWQAARNREQVPPAIDLPVLASRLAERVGAERVHVVLAETPAELARQALAVLDVDARVEARGADVVAVELLRELNPLVVVATGQPRRDEIVAGPWATVLVGRPAPAPLAVPSGWAGWAEDAAARMAGRLDSGDYAVHGDPAVLGRQPMTGERDARGEVPAEDVLELALDLIASLWRPAEGSS